MAFAGHAPTYDGAYRAGAFAFVSALAVILAALAFERSGGMVPCPLCLMQRWAFYAGIPVLFVALVLLVSGRPRASAWLFGLVAVGFLANAGLAGYHAGVEWKFWLGPDTCSTGVAPLSPGAGGLLKDIERTRVVRCDEAPWRFLGLSFAGWNVVVSLAIAVASTRAARGAAAR